MKNNIITRDELVKLQNSGKPFKLVDTRFHSSYEKQHLPNAIAIPLAEIREKATQFLSKDDLIVVYCANFECEASTKAAHILDSLGFKNVLNYTGGIKDYQEGGLSFEEKP